MHTKFLKTALCQEHRVFPPSAGQVCTLLRLIPVPRAQGVREVCIKNDAFSVNDVYR